MHTFAETYCGCFAALYRFIILLFAFRLFYYVPYFFIYHNITNTTSVSSIFVNVSPLMYCCLCLVCC
jgi:hypothetical protein